MTGHPVALVVGVLAVAVLCLGVGTLRGSFRFWLVGYALAAAALVIAYGGVRAARSARAAWSAPASTAPAAPGSPTPAAPTPGGRP